MGAWSDAFHARSVPRGVWLGRTTECGRRYPSTLSRIARPTASGPMWAAITGPNWMIGISPPLANGLTCSARRAASSGVVL